MSGFANRDQWVTKPLVDVATLQRGYDLPVQDRTSGSYPIFAANGSVGLHGFAKCKGPGVVTGRSGTIGKVHFVEDDYWPLNTSLYVKDFHGNDPKWVYYMLKCFGLEQFSQGAGVPTLNRNLVHGEPVKVPPLEQQRRIAAILDQAETLRTQRRAALAQLDSLAQSLFLDMFGDPVANPKFPVGTIRQFVEANSGKSSKLVLSECPTDIPIYGGNGINGWATAPLYEQPVLVFGRVGQQCGNAFITEGLSWVTDNAIVIRITDASKLIEKYILHAFQGSDFSNRVKHLDLPFINQGMILDNPIPIPPLALQKSFATRIQAIESLKTTHRTALTELDALFASLQQRAFAGEL